MVISRGFHLELTQRGWRWGPYSLPVRRGVKAAQDTLERRVDPSSTEGRCVPCSLDPELRGVRTGVLNRKCQTGHWVQFPTAGKLLSRT